MIRIGAERSRLSPSHRHSLSWNQSAEKARIPYYGDDLHLQPRLCRASMYTISEFDRLIQFVHYL